MEFHSFAISLLKLGTQWIEDLFINFSVFFFLLAVICIVIGVVILGISLYARIKGTHITGTVVGAVQKKRIKIKERDGEEIKEEKNSYYYIYEYEQSDGSLHQEISSQGMNKNTPYKTGDQVDILVCPAIGYDDVYDAKDYSGFKIGIVVLLLGAALMTWIIDEYGMRSSFWLTLLMCCIPIIVKLITIFTTGSRTPLGERPPVKQFKKDDIKSVEEIFNIMSSRPTDK